MCWYYYQYKMQLSWADQKYHLILYQHWVVCSTPHALSPDAHNPGVLSPCALGPHGLRNTYKNQALPVDFFFGNLSKIVFLSYIKETGLSS